MLANNHYSAQSCPGMAIHTYSSQSPTLTPAQTSYCLLPPFTTTLTSANFLKTRHNTASHPPPSTANGSVLAQPGQYPPPSPMRMRHQYPPQHGRHLLYPVWLPSTHLSRPETSATNSHPHGLTCKLTISSHPPTLCTANQAGSLPYWGPAPAAGSCVWLPATIASISQPPPPLLSRLAKTRASQTARMCTSAHECEFHPCVTCSNSLGGLLYTSPHTPGPLSRLSLVSCLAAASLLLLTLNPAPALLGANALRCRSHQAPRSLPAKTTINTHRASVETLFCGTAPVIRC